MTEAGGSEIREGVAGGSVLVTPRLQLRLLRSGDLDAIVRYASAREIASMTLSIPHPLEREEAEAWLAAMLERVKRGEAFPFAIVPKGEEALVGVVGLHPEEHERAEVGFWVGVPFHGRGYCTEALRAVIGWGFETRSLHRIHAMHFPENVASARVLAKVGMTREGRLRQHVKKWDRWRDVEVMAILESEWRSWREREAPRGV